MKNEKWKMKNALRLCVWKPLSDNTIWKLSPRGDGGGLFLRKIRQELIFLSISLDESETGYFLVAEIVNILCDEKYLAPDGNPDVEKMGLITFDPVHHNYIQLGKTVGKAFSDGKQLK